MENPPIGNQMGMHEHNQEVENYISDDFHTDPKKRLKKRVQQFSDSKPDDDNKDECDVSVSKTSGSCDDESLNKTNARKPGLEIIDQSESCNSELKINSSNLIKYGLKKSMMKRVQRFSDSESECEKENRNNVSSSKSSSGESEENLVFNIKKQRSRIKVANNSDSDSESSADEALKNEQQQLCMKNKRNKLKEKFKNFVTLRLNESEIEKSANSNCGSESENSKNSDSSRQSDSEGNSIERIKHNIKDKTPSYKTTICDPDTSDEENYSSSKSLPQKKKERKTAKLTSPKPIRMTAKQAMENMKKIKSESNRMLREKEVTLPYHRPKALSLKDIMSRRKPALSSDGKSLPIKMNEDQLRQYVKILEERQKEMMELCKSDTDDDPGESETQAEEKLEESINNDQCENPPLTEINEESRPTFEDDVNKSNDNPNVSFETVNKEISNSFKLDEVKDNVNETSTDTKSCDINIENTVTNKELDSNLTSNDDVGKDVEINNKCEEKSANDSMNSNGSNIEMSLVYNDSIEETSVSIENGVTVCNEKGKNIACEKTEEVDLNKGTEPDSQLVSLHYDTEKTKGNTNDVETKEDKPQAFISKDISDIAFDEVCRDNEFSDDDMINMDEIDKLIENVEVVKDNIYKDNSNSPMLISDSKSTIKPKLTGAPGMVIDLDGTDAIARKKLSGLELLKERFTYFAKLKTPEEHEREKEKRLKPGAQHLKLKQELEEKIAEQRSLEWAKRLQEEKQQQMEMDAIRGDESEDEIDKIEAKLEEKSEILDEKESSESEESEEEMQEIEEKPRKKNPMIDDEAEESDVEECAGDANEEEEERDENDEGEENNEESDDSSEESSESEEETEVKTKKGRILKAFEDSDEEDASQKDSEAGDGSENNKAAEEPSENKNNLESQAILDSQDEDLQLAQRHKSFSGDLFTSQESAAKTQTNASGSYQEPDIGTQTFSILNDATTSMAMDLYAPEKDNVISETQPNNDPNLDAVVGMCSGSFTQNLVDTPFSTTKLPAVEKLDVISETQPNDEPNLDAVVGMCSGSFSQNLVTSQFPAESQPIGEDVLNLCTGKFYDNQFVSQTNDSNNKINESSQLSATAEVYEKPTENKIKEDNNLKSILEELNDPEFDEPKPKKYFIDNKETSNILAKNKFIIDSDDDANNDDVDLKPKKKIKKKKLEKRALRISDDEDESNEEYENDGDDGEEQDYMSEEDVARMVEYDSEENEVEIKPQKEKKKRKMAEFFEQEAELTSEDEWAGSGDEDEADLDRMEREAGDDDTFHQATLQRELGQIHMRDVLDQDKREVRLIQELLFEDGDLGDGHRQRKFRWRNADGEEEVGTVPDELADTQEEEMESEEQWRKQRHERELFLRQMQNQEEEDVNVSINRTTIIKANLCSRTMSSLLSEVNKTTDVSVGDKSDSPVVLEKSKSKDIPSPKKAFTVFQQNYHGSLLSRGGGALARLAALAAPVAGQDSLSSAKRNFVFTARPDHDETKVTKRKADTNVGTPRLVKKMKTEDKKKPPRSSLLDHLKV